MEMRSVIVHGVVYDKRYCEFSGHWRRECTGNQEVKETLPRHLTVRHQLLRFFGKLCNHNQSLLLSFKYRIRFVELAEVISMKELQLQQMVDSINDPKTCCPRNCLQILLKLLSLEIMTGSAGTSVATLI
jgi:hypothetical protein